MVANSVLEALISGRRLIEAGWVKGSPISGHTASDCWCAATAITWNKETGRFASEALELLESVMPQRGWPGVVQYNDSKETTKADILGLYDRAIDKARVRA